ncbi:MAG: flagellar export chaperone FliS [Clostridium sp.]
MYQNNGFNAYKNNSVNHASKEQLLLMLVDGAVKFTKRAKLALEENRIKECHDSLIRAQDIYTELMITLDTSAGDWATQMYNVYDYIKFKLGEANLTKDVKHINEVMPLVEEVRDIWHEAEKISKGKR